jgi:hypothetical protein
MLRAVRLGSWKGVMLLAGGAIGIAMLMAFVLAPVGTAAPCTVAAGPTKLPEIPEASGLAIGRRTAGVIWSHNDSGNAEVLFALDTSGRVRGRVRLPLRMRDWEDSSAARCEFGACLYLGDIGDNGFARRRIQIARVPEPAPSDAQTAPPEVFNATYSDGRHNAEAMFVIGADLFIVTRDRTGGVYRATQVGDSPRQLTFERIGQLGLEVVTDAEASADEKSVAVRTSHEVLVYRTAELIKGGTTPFARIPIDGLNEAQGEGVALGVNGMLYLASEGRPWSRPGIFIGLRCNSVLGS